MIIAAVAKVSCKHELWLVARVNESRLLRAYGAPTIADCIRNPGYRPTYSYSLACAISINPTCKHAGFMAAAQDFHSKSSEIWEDIMLEKIMNLHILLYSMAGLGALGAIGMLATHLTYRRMLKSTGSKITGTKINKGTGSPKVNLKEKWLNLWKTRDRLLHRMNRLVWYPALLSTVLLGCAIYFSVVLRMEEGLPLTYLYVGTAVPVALLLLRQVLDFSYKEELIMDTLADYVEQMRTWVEEIPVSKKTDPVLQEEVVDKITSSIRQTAAAGSHFSKMLTPEEEKIMREIIREFMA